MTLSDIKNRVYLLTKSNSTSFAAADILIALNMAMNRVTSLILQADGRWQWDDDNQSDLPIATSDITANQQDYSFPVNYLSILRVEIKFNGGNYFYKLKPKDVSDTIFPGLSPIGFDTLTKGQPFYYDIVGHSVFLFPIPNYTQTASLRVFFERSAIDFTSADLSNGTAVPGFASIFHDLIPLWISYDYAIANGLKNANQIFTEIQRKEAELTAYYGNRNKDDRPQLQMTPIRFR